MKVATTTAFEISRPGHRIDASYHASDGVKAFRFIEKWEGSISKSLVEKDKYLSEKRVSYGAKRTDALIDVCKPDGIFIPSRFKRTFVESEDFGTPYLTGSSILLVDPKQGAKYLSSAYTANLKKLLLSNRMILITCSGTIGNMVYVNSVFANAVGSPDLLRIIAEENIILPGYLYAFLSSSLGQSLIKQKTYGAVVPHIEAHHVWDIPVPRLSSGQENDIHGLIEKASKFREQALKKQEEADKKLYSQLKIELSKLEISKQCVVRSSDLNSRFDGSFQVAKYNVEGVLQNGDIPLVEIGTLLIDIFYLGKLHRVFVDDPQYGVPLLSIADVQRAKLKSDKHVSKSRSRNVNQAKLQRGQVLVSRVGTPGIVTYVRKEMEEFAGTDHLVRLVADKKKILPGYLYAFLNSKLGQLLLINSAHGSVQSVLPPSYIEQIKIPLLPMNLQQIIHALIEEYSEDLSMASSLEDEAQALLLDALGWKE